MRITTMVTAGAVGAVVVAGALVIGTSQLTATAQEGPGTIGAGATPVATTAPAVETPTATAAPTTGAPEPTTEAPEPTGPPVHGGPADGPDPTRIPRCETGCEVVFALTAAGDGQLYGLQTSEPGTGAPTALVAWFDRDDALVAVAEPVADAYVQPSAQCGGPQERRCVVAFAVGAHGTQVLGLDLDGGAITATGQVDSTTPTVQISDLDQDGDVDVSVRQSTYEPSYAAAPRFWQTFLRHDGAFVLSGCGELTTEPRDVPTAPLTGACP